MSNETPEKGDKVEAQWGSSAPGGTVVEEKTEGEVSVQSKKGNTIKKAARPGDPAVAIERSGNNLVKNEHELTVKSKAKGGAKRKADDEGEKEDTKKEKKEETKKDEAEKKKAGRPKGTSSGAEKKKKKKKDVKLRSTEGIGSRTRSRAKA